MLPLHFGKRQSANFVFENGLGGIVVTDILNNVITTKDMSTFLFPNVFVFFGDTTQCCVLGFHTYFFEPGSDPEMRWVLNYSSWISRGCSGQLSWTSPSQPRNR